MSGEVLGTRSNGNIQLLAGEGMFRIGAGYEFALGKHFTLAPEAQVDFIAGGTKVHVVAIALGYGF